jgi:hypothetical protein
LQIKTEKTNLVTEEYKFAYRRVRKDFYFLILYLFKNQNLILFKNLKSINSNKLLQHDIFKTPPQYLDTEGVTDAI